MPRIVDCLATPMAAGMFRDDATILANDNAIGIGMDVDRPPDGAGVHRVLVVVEAHQAGLRHRRRQRVEAVEPATIRDEIWPLLLEDVPYRLVRPFRMGMHLGVGDTFVGQPGVQLIVGFDPKPRREKTFPDQTDLVLDLTLLPTRGRRAGHRINQVMAAHLQEAAIILTVLADEDRLHRRLHVVVDATGAGTSKEGEGAFVRVEYHLLRLTRISPAEHHPAVAQADMRNLHGHRDAAHHNDLVAPIELVGFARRERQWNEGGRGLAHVLPAPGPCVTAHGVVATLVAQRPQFFEQPDQGQTLSSRGLGIRRQHPIEIGLPPSQPGPRLDLPLVRKRCLPRAQDLADRIARDLQVTGDLLDRLALDQMLAPYPADRLHNQHPRHPLETKRAAQQSRIQGVNFGRRSPGSGVKFARRITLWFIRTLHKETNRDFTLSRVTFTHARNADLREVHRLLRCPVDFAQAVDSWVLPQRIMDLPIVSGDSQLLKILTAHADDLLADRESVTGLQSTVANQLTSLLPSGEARAAVVARQLGMSPRSLTRHLTEEGTTFGEILEQLRQRLASRYLADDRMSVQQIAWLLGYSEVGAFNHAYKRWTGTTPRGTRKPAAIPR